METAITDEDIFMETAITEKTDKPWLWKKGQSGNPSGRPKGTLKDYVREKFVLMSPEEKEEFLIKISPEMQWRMGEGNPHQATDVTSDGKALVLPSEIILKNDSTPSSKPDSERPA
jgi:hypothetical protein